MSYCKFGAETQKNTHLWTNSTEIIRAARGMVCSGASPCANFRNHASVRGRGASEASEFPPGFADWLALYINASAEARGARAPAG